MSRRRPGRPRGAAADAKGVQAVERALTLLESLSRAHDGMKFAELQSALDLPTATTHRLIKTLVHAGYVREDGARGIYVLGGRFMHLASRAMHQRTQFRILARPFLQELVQRTSETANLATLEGDEASYLDQVPSERMVRAGTFLRVPLYCSGTGKSLLAFQEPSRVEELIGRVQFAQLTAHTIGSRDRLIAELTRVRSQGFSVDDEEMEIGTRCVAAPICVDGLAIASVSIAGPTTRVTADQVRPLSVIVRDVASRLSTAAADRFPGITADELMEPFVG